MIKKYFQRGLFWTDTCSPYLVVTVPWFIDISLHSGAKVCISIVHLLLLVRQGTILPLAPALILMVVWLQVAHRSWTVIQIM